MIKHTINRPIEVFMYMENPSRGQMGRYLRLLKSEIEKKQQETVLSSCKADVEADTRACNYNTARLSCGLIRTATTRVPRQRGHELSTTTQSEKRGEAELL